MKIFAALICLFTFSASGQNQLLNAKDLKSFTGNWQGKLEYSDFKDNSKLVTLPTKLAVSGAADSLVLQYEYSEPSGKIVKSREVWKIVSFGEQLRINNETSDVSVLNRQQNHLTIIIYRLGNDNEKSAMIEKTITLSGSSFEITKRVKYDSGGDYFVRNVYTFRKN